MTAQLPPNLLKLFAPRPPIPYVKPYGPDPNAVHPLKLGGIGELFEQIKAEAAAKEEKRLETGKDEEDGEVPVVEAKFTLCEEEKRKLRADKKKKRKEDLEKNADASCQPCPLSCLCFVP
jgi:U1 small nuclear ribonucleoprotein